MRSAGQGSGGGGTEDSHGDGWPVTPADRAALLRKYRLLATWRQIRDAAGNEDRDRQDVVDGDAGAPDRRALQALAREFPGALRELDVLGLPEILRRIARLADDAAGAPMTGGGGKHDSGDAWIAWIVAYHGIMRAALLAKRRAGRTRQISPTAMAQVVRDVGAAAGIALDEDFVRAAAHPPGGRLTVLVMGRLSQHFAMPATHIAATLFPPRRPSPYRL